MSDTADTRGYYRMARGWLDHPVLGGPYDRRSAWAWLIEHAAFRARRFDVGGRVIELQRGQLTVSYRYLAERWRWSKTVVERFIARLKTETMIGTDTGTGQLIITICNYDRYQIGQGEGGTPTGTDSGTGTGHQRDTSGTKQKEGNECKEGNKGRKNADSRRKGRSASASDIESRFAEWWACYPRRVARAAALRAFAVALAKTDVATLAAGAQRYARECVERGTESRYIAHAATWLRAERWTDPAEPTAAPRNNRDRVNAAMAATLGRGRRQRSIAEICADLGAAELPVLDLTPDEVMVR